MPDADLDQLLRRPAVVAAVRELGLASRSLEDVLSALRAFGSVRIVVYDHPEQPYVCLLEACEYGESLGTVLHAALACWAGALESLDHYTEQGVLELERFLLGPDVA